LVFIGTYEHTIDAKQRLAIPSEIRAQIRAACGYESDDDIALFVTPGEGNALCLYTEQQFSARATELDQADRSTEEILAYEQLFYSLTRRVSMDKHGRIRLPENLLKLAGLSGDVVLLGVKDRLEIRDRQTWQEYVQQTLQASPGVLVNPRRIMRQPRADRF
jgi:MraZ protein